MTASRCLLALVLLTAASACSPGHMVIPTELKSGHVPVKDRGGWFETGPLTIGEYEATGIDRGWTSSSGTFKFVGSSTKTKQTYRFDFVNAGVVTPVGCITRLQERDIDFGLLNYHEGKIQLDCGTGAYPTMRVSGVEDGHYIGFLQAPGALIEVRSNHRVEETPFSVGLIGFEFYYNGRPVAALQTSNVFRLWVDPAMPVFLRDSIVMHAAALMLYEELDSGS